MYGKHLARALFAALIAIAAFGALASTAAAATVINGAGSTLVAPLEEEWASAWAAQNSGVSINYNPVGSGKGLQEIAAGQVDFGASDAPLSASPVNCAGCVQIPWALSATGIGFHINNLSHLHLTGSVLAQIYLGQITNWSDPRIRKLNKGTHLPNLKIIPYFRTDGSGDTYALIDYLDRVSSAFRSKIGAPATTVTWPTGVGAKGNTGMANALAQNNGSIAYVAVSYLIALWPHAAAIKNAAGNYEVPNFKEISNAARSVHIGANNEVHIVDPPRSAKRAYPISTFTYVIVPGNASQGSILRSFISYALTTGQSLGPRLDFVPIPKSVKNAGLSTLSHVQ
ncbi:MAG: phosphate ABC transporter substrate-binding protein PstS [Solirubrobacterales bacterium]|nr:phosphate ABC transporter substrate-binding protein PstS [Solirubrobacterales bacterium]